MKYGTILYEVRDALQISNNEYLLLDAVSKLQNNQDTPGWCNASAAYLAWVVGISRRNIFPLYERLVSRNLLEIRPTDSAKRVTQFFVDAAITGDVTSLYDVTSLVMLHPKGGDATSPGVVMLHPKTGDVASPNNTDNTDDKTVIRRAPRAPKKPTSVRQKNRDTPMPSSGAPRLTTFADSIWATETPEAWRVALATETNIPDLDAAWYFHRCKDWSAEKGSTSANWVVTAAKFARDDQRKQQLVTLQPITDHDQPSHSNPRSSQSKPAFRLTTTADDVRAVAEAAFASRRRRYGTATPRA